MLLCYATLLCCWSDVLVCCGIVCLIVLRCCVVVCLLYFVNIYGVVLYLLLSL